MAGGSADMAEVHPRSPPDPGGQPAITQPPSPSSVQHVSPDSTILETANPGSAHSDDGSRRGNNTVTTPSDAQDRSTLATLVTTSDNFLPATGSRRNDARSYATVVQSENGPESTRRTRRPNARKLKPTFSAPVIQKLENTLAKDWISPRAPNISRELEVLQETSLAEADTHADDSLRTRTPQENAALLAYFRGELELKHPPNFIKATMPVLQRAMVEQFHEAHVEYSLSAIVPPQVKLWKNMSHAALFAELLDANRDEVHGEAMITRMQRDVKMLHYDGTQTLRFVFHSKRIGQFYHRTTMRFQRTTITIEDADRPRADQLPGSFNVAQVKRLYSLRVLGADKIGLVSLIAAFSQLAGVPVLDAQRPRATDSYIVDNRYIEVIFGQTTCPVSLLGVTQVQLGSSYVKLHHHLLHARAPCSRCFSPKHTTGFCKVKAEHLKQVRRRGRRIFNGRITPFDVGTAVTYHHTDCASLENFIATLQVELDLPENSSAFEAQLVVESDAPQAPEFTSDPAVDTTDEGGYTVVRSTSARRRAARNTAAVMVVDNTANGTATPLRSQPGLTTTSADAQYQTSAEVQVEDALAVPNEVRKDAAHSSSHEEASIPVTGRYDVLMSDDEDDSANDSTHSAEEAPYAFANDDEESNSESDPVNVAVAMEVSIEPEKVVNGVEATEAEEHRFISHRQHHQWETEVEMHKESDVMTVIVREDVDDLRSSQLAQKLSGGNVFEPEEMDVSVDTFSHPPADSVSHDSYVGSSAPTTTPSPASTPGMECPYSLASQENDTPSSPPEPDSPVTYVGTIPPSRNPTQAQFWLSWFNGHEVAVPANGQCAMLALYATTLNHPEAKLKLTPSVITDANAMKKMVYSLMVANLVQDFKGGLVDPIAELLRYHPACQPPESMDAAMAMLMTHWLKERDRSVAADVPSSHWAGFHELRAMAQYLRQPLIVMDVNKNGDAHVQLYTFKHHAITQPSGRVTTDHESGVCIPLTDDVADRYLTTCGRLHVLPIILLLRNHESHFYGVGHGDIFLKWEAEGDPGYAQTLLDRYDWASEYISKPSDVSVYEVDSDIGFVVSKAGKPINLMDDTDAVNEVLRQSLPTRQRLDIAQVRMGWPPLDEVPYDVKEIEDHMLRQVREVQRNLGMDSYAVGTCSLGTEDLGMNLPRRASVVNRCRITASLYYQMLGEPADTERSVAINLKFTAANEANANAFREWCLRYRRQLGIPSDPALITSITTLLNWMSTHAAACRHLFAYLPYPELAAKMMPTSFLLHWGQYEAFREQKNMIRRISEDQQFSVDLRNYCGDWYNSCTAPDSPTIAESSDKWKHICGDVDVRYGRARPDTVSETTWYLLHILPYVVRHWEVAPMGMTPLGSRANWFAAYPSLGKLCSGILQENNWSHILHITAGITWEEWEADEALLIPLQIRK